MTAQRFRYFAAAALLLALLVCGIIFAPAHASAATPVSAGPAIDFSGIVNGFVLPVLQALVLGVLGVAFAYVAKHYNLQIAASNQAFIESAISTGIAGVQAKLAPSEQISAPGSVAQIVQLVLTEAPLAAKFLNLTPASVSAMVTARLPA